MNGLPGVASIGRKSREFEVAVARTGIGFVEINKTGDQNVEVQIALLDAAGRAIGSVEVKFPYPAGSGLDENQLRRAGEIVRDEMAQQIPQQASLFEPAANVAAPGAPTTAAGPITKMVEEAEGKESLGNKQSLPMTKEVASGAALSQTLRGRTTYEMSGEVPASKRIGWAKLAPGDVLFFGAHGPRSRPSEVDHTGIYLGNRWFIHSSGYGVAVAQLSGWYRQRFAWGRRPLAEAGLTG